VRPKEEAPLCGAFAEPSDGLEPSTPSLPDVVSPKTSADEASYSRRSSARASARRSVMGFRSESARSRMTARSLSVEDVPAPASAFARRVRMTLSSNATFRPLRSNSIIRRTPRDSTAHTSGETDYRQRLVRSLCLQAQSTRAAVACELIEPGTVSAPPAGRVADAASAGLCWRFSSPKGGTIGNQKGLERG
jgi:hypothetical protein